MIWLMFSGKSKTPSSSREAVTVSMMLAFSKGNEVLIYPKKKIGFSLGNFGNVIFYEFANAAMPTFVLEHHVRRFSHLLHGI